MKGKKINSIINTNNAINLKEDEEKLSNNEDSDSEFEEIKQSDVKVKHIEKEKEVNKIKAKDRKKQKSKQLSILRKYEEEIKEVPIIDETDKKDLVTETTVINNSNKIDLSKNKIINNGFILELNEGNSNNNKATGIPKLVDSLKTNMISKVKDNYLIGTKRLNRKSYMKIF